MQQLKNRYWVWVALFAIILFSGAIRVRLLDVPLERDEGEYAYAGQLILDGVPPYAEVYNMKMPGIYAAYALIMAIFGQTLTGIHLGLLVINTATIFLVFLLGKKLFDPVAGVVAAAAYALLSSGQNILGFTANAEHFVILPAVGGILLLTNAIDYQKWRSLITGAVLLGLAFMMKQHGAAFIVFGGLYLFWAEIWRRPFNWKLFAAKGIVFAAGAMLPFAATCIILWWYGVFGKFWFWTFDYAAKYVSAVPLSESPEYFKVSIIPVVRPAILLWILAGVGLTGLWWNKKAHQHRLFMIGFLLFSFLSVCPGFYFRNHYFILMLPVVALLGGVGISSIQTLFVKSRMATTGGAISILLALLALYHTVYLQRNYFFVMSPAGVARSTYGANPFPESLEIARFIKEHTTKADRIAVLGSEPQIYFYSDRRSATGYVYTYALMEYHDYARKMQEEMIREIESHRPKFLVFVNLPASWLPGVDSENLIFEWFNQYRDKYYRKVGIIDILSLEQTVYRWGWECENYTPRSSCWVCVFQRKD